MKLNNKELELLVEQVFKILEVKSEGLPVIFSDIRYKASIAYNCCMCCLEPEKQMNMSMEERFKLKSLAEKIIKLLPGANQIDIYVALYCYVSLGTENFCINNEMKRKIKIILERMLKLFTQDIKQTFQYAANPQKFGSMEAVEYRKELREIYRVLYEYLGIEPLHIRTQLLQESLREYFMLTYKNRNFTIEQLLNDNLFDDKEKNYDSCMKAACRVINTRVIEKLKDSLIYDDRNIVYQQVDFFTEKRITARDFLIRTNVFRCIKKSHNLENINARVKVITHDGKEKYFFVPAAYCNICNKYYILEKDYQWLKACGLIVCRIQEYNMTFQKGDFGYDLAQESFLYSLGYNVNAQTNLTKMQRQILLKTIIDEKIMTKTEICSFLDYLIRRSEGNELLKEACAKWRIDRNFVFDYSVNSPIVEVESMKKNNYRK